MSAPSTFGQEGVDPQVGRSRRSLPRLRRAGLVGALVAVAAAIGALAAPPSVSAVAVGTLSVSPSNQTVAAGAPFSIDILEHAGGAVSEAQTDLVFNASLLQVQDIKLGSVWAPANGSLIYQPGVTTTPDAINAANESGTLTIGAATLGSIPAGDATLVSISFKALPGPGGVSALRLSRATMLDPSQNPLAVVVTSGSVTIMAGAPVSPGPSASGFAGSSASPSASALACVSPLPALSPSAGLSTNPSGSPAFMASASPCGSSSQPTPGPSATPSGPAEAQVYVAPDKDQVAVGDTVVVTLYANSDNELSSMAVDFSFDPTLLQVVSVDPTSDWPGAAINIARKNVLQAIIDRANSGVGIMQGIGVNIPPQGAEASVSGSFLTITMKAVKDGTSTLSAANVSAIDLTGANEAVPPAGATLVIKSAGTTGATNGGGFSLNLDWPLAISAAILTVELFACLLVLLLPARMLRLSLPRRPNLPYVGSMALGLVPVLSFAACIAIVVVNALPAFSDPGVLAFFDTKSISMYSAQGAVAVAYGLVPALLGTVMIVGIALAIAVPVSISLALVTTEFQMGPLGRILRPVVTLMSGIPPIVYAASMLVFVQLVMIPKFAADSTYDTFSPTKIGANPTTWPPAGVPFSAGSYPWESSLGNSTLLGGLLVALLVIPFMTPMIADAFRNVPNSIREASLALGANRSYTIRKSLLPIARPAIISAVILGALKAAGDVVIVAFAVGWSANSIPNPVFDVFERTPSLAVHAADMIVPLETPDSTNSALLQSVGFVGALALLIVAMVAVVVGHILRRRWSQRLGQ